MNDAIQQRTVAVLTVARSDFGRYRPVLKALSDMPGITLRLLASGNHFQKKFGHTIDEIESAGYSWVPGLEIDQNSDAPADVGRAIADGTRKITDYFETERPDLLVVLGDRYEMLTGAMAALGFNIPVVHIHGGAVTEGAIDELVRHALTKMSHVHLVSCEPYADRLRQMGEEAWRIHVTGAPGLDELPSFADMSRQSLSKELALNFDEPTLLVCLHPETVTGLDIGHQADSLLAAVKETGLQAVLTYPNTDPGSTTIIDAFRSFAKANSGRVQLIKNAGTRRFANLLANAAAIVGNSSSAIVEAPTFKLPAVNIGKRQEGKVKAENVIDTHFDSADIKVAIETALSVPFKTSLKQMTNPYGDGQSGERIAKIIASVPLGTTLLCKRFIDA